MRLTRPLLLSAAAIAVVGIAYAERPQVHVARYALPGGGVAQVRYVGEVPRRLVLAADPALAVAENPMASFDRVAAMMDARADALFAQAAVTADAEPGAEPAGTRRTSITRTASDGKVCTSEVSTVSSGDGKPPRVIRKLSGDCGSMPPAPATPTPPTKPETPDLRGTI